MNKKNRRSPLEPFVMENVRRSPRKKPVKEKEKGRRRLDFNKGEKKLTRNILHKYVAYVDVKLQTKADAIKKRITTLGGVVEEFLDKETNLIVTCQNITDLTDKYGYVLPSVQSPMSATQPSPLQLFSNKQSYGASPLSTDSPQNSVEGGKRDRLSNEYSLGKKLISRALSTRRGAGTPNICQRAKNLNARLLSVDDFYKRFMQNKNSTSNIRSLKEKPFNNLKKPSTRTVAEVQVFKLNDPFLKIEDTKRCFRPLFYEAKSWPRIHFDTSLYQSPFELPKGRKHNRSKTIGNAECDLLDEETLSLPDKREKISEQEEPSKAKPVSPVVSKPLISKKNNSKKNDEKPGYCDICTVRYKDLKKHLKNDQHRKFVTNKSNFKQLDSLIAECTLFDGLVGDLKACAKLREHNRQIFNDKLNEENKQYKTPVQLIPCFFGCEDGIKAYCVPQECDNIHEVVHNESDDIVVPVQDMKKQLNPTSALIPCLLGFQEGIEVCCNPQECDNSHENDSDDVDHDVIDYITNTSKNLDQEITCEKSSIKTIRLDEEDNNKENLLQRDTLNAVERFDAITQSPDKFLISAAEQRGRMNFNYKSIIESDDANSIIKAQTMVSTPVKELQNPVSTESKKDFFTVDLEPTNLPSLHTATKLLVVPKDEQSDCNNKPEKETPSTPPATPPVCDSPNIIRRTRRTRKRRRLRTLSSSSQAQSQYTQETNNQDDNDCDDSREFISILEEEIQQKSKTPQRSKNADNTNQFESIQDGSQNVTYETNANKDIEQNVDQNNGTSTDYLFSPTVFNENKNKRHSRISRRTVVTLESGPEVVFTVKTDHSELCELFSPQKSTYSAQIKASLNTIEKDNTNVLTEDNILQERSFSKEVMLANAVNNNIIREDSRQNVVATNVNLSTGQEVSVTSSKNLSIPEGVHEKLNNEGLKENSNNPAMEVKTPSKITILFSDDEDVDDVTHYTNITNGLKVEEFQSVDKISVTILKHGSTPESGKLRKITPRKDRKDSKSRSTKKNTPKFKFECPPNSLDQNLTKSPTLVSCKRNLRSMNTPPRRRKAFNDTLSKLNKYSPNSRVTPKQRYYNSKKRCASTPSYDNKCRKRSRTDSGDFSSTTISESQSHEVIKHGRSAVPKEGAVLIYDKITELDDDVFTDNNLAAENNNGKVYQGIQNILRKRLHDKNHTLEARTDSEKDSSKLCRQRDTPSLEDLTTIQSFIYDRIKNHPRKSSSVASQTLSRSSSRTSSPPRNEKPRIKTKSNHKKHENEKMQNKMRSLQDESKHAGTRKSPRKKYTETPLESSPKTSTVKSQGNSRNKSPKLRSSPRMIQRQQSRVSTQQGSNTSSVNTSFTKKLKTKHSPFSAITANKEKTQRKNSSFEIFDFNDKEHTYPIIKTKKRDTSASHSLSEQSLDSNRTVSTSSKKYFHKKARSKTTEISSPSSNKIYLIKKTSTWKIRDPHVAYCFDESDSDDFKPTKKSRTKTR